MNETSSRLKIHNCVVEKVYESGLIDATSNRGHRFKYINIVYSGTENSYKEGDRCVIISDGAQHFVLGKTYNPKRDEDGNIQVKKSREDIISLKNANVVEASDNIGNQSKQILHPAAGIISDAGDGVVQHMDPGKSCIRNFSEREETITIPHYKEVWHQDGECTSFYKWRSEVDEEAFSEEMKGKPNNQVENTSNNLKVSIDNDEDFLEIKVDDGDDTQSNIILNKSGGIKIESNEDEVNIIADGDVTVKSGGNVEVQADDNIEADAGGDIEADASGDIIGDAGGGVEITANQSIEASNNAAELSIGATGSINLGNMVGNLDISSAGGTTLGKTPTIEIGSIVAKLSDMLETCKVVTPIGAYDLIHQPAQTLTNAMVMALQQP